MLQISADQGTDALAQLKPSSARKGCQHFDTRLFPDLGPSAQVLCTAGVTAQGLPSSAAAASAGSARMTWWGGLIICLAVLLVLSAAVLAAFLLRRRWRRQRQVDEVPFTPLSYKLSGDSV